MTFDITTESVTIAIGVITLIVGVVNSIKTNKRLVKSQHLQVILTLSESFREKWESDWNVILEELAVDHLEPRTHDLPIEYVSDVRCMLNWVDWLGAMKSSGALDELNIITSSIGVPMKKIINAGYPILKEDTEKYGKEYWSNLFIVANMLGVAWVEVLDSGDAND